MSGNGYPVRRLGEVLQYVRRPITPDQTKTYSLIGVRWYGEGTHLHDMIDGATLQAPTLWKVQNDDIIYNKMWTSKGAFAVVTKNTADLFGTSEYPTFIAHGACPEFLRYTFRQPRFWQLAEAWANGTTERARLNPKDFLKLPISVPLLPEQRAIAEVLIAIEDAIARTEALIGVIGAVKAAVIERFLLNGLTGNDSERRHGYKSTKWNVVRLRDLAMVQTGISKSENRAHTFPIDVAYLRVANVQDGYLDLDEVKVIRIDRSQMERYRLRVGDVLFNEGGDFDKLGRGCVWSGEIDPCVHQNHVFAVRCGPKLDPRFLALFAASRRGKSYFKRSSKQTTNLASINMSDLRSFPVPVPHLNQQQHIAEIANCFDLRIFSEIQMFKRLVSIRAAISQELLSGRLRLPESTISRHREHSDKMA